MAQIFAWALSLVAVFFGAKWNSAMKENELLKERLSPSKEKLYSDILKFLTDYLRRGKRVDEAEFKEKTIEFEERFLLNSSNNVLLAYADLHQNFFDPNISQEEKSKRTFVAYGNLILEMRKDLGHGSFLHPLFWFDPLRLSIKDINKVLPEDKQGFRLQANKSMRINKPLPQES